MLETRVTPEHYRWLEARAEDGIAGSPPCRPHPVGYYYGFDLLDESKTKHYVYDLIETLW